MKIAYVKAQVQEWVRAHVGEFPGLVGAYISGSFLGAQPGGLWPASSDMDIMLVFEPGACPPKMGKRREKGVLLELSCLDAKELAPLEHVLSTHYLAYALNAGAILYDPQGILGRVHRQVQAEYARRPWVLARCESFYNRIKQGVQGFCPDHMGLPQMVNGWAFTTGIACFPILLADLQNCTVRKRYPAARQVLEAYGLVGFYPQLLSLLVPEPLGQACLAGHMRQLEETFRLACGTAGASASYPFRQDITPEGAAIALGGSWELLDTPHPEDAVFWMLATFARCHIIFEMDGPGLGARRLPALWAFLKDLGIGCKGDFAVRLKAVLDFLPALRGAVGEILDKREGRGR